MLVSGLPKEFVPNFPKDRLLIVRVWTPTQLSFPRSKALQANRPYLPNIELTRMSSGSMSDKLISPMSISPLESMAECMLIASGSVSDTSADDKWRDRWCAERFGFLKKN